MTNAGTPKKRTIGTVKVESLMTAEVQALAPGLTIKEAIEFLLQHRISGAPLVDQHRMVLSVVSEFDLMRFAAEGELNTLLSAKMDKLVPADQVISVRKSDTFVTVFKLFLTRGIRRLVVVDETGKLQGILSRSNVIRAFMQYEG